MVAVVVLPFTEELSRLGPEEFVRRILKEGLDARAVVVGENFRFGRRQAGDTRLLAELGRQYGFLTEVMPAVRRRGRPVSSSEIRGLIERGEVAFAARLLGRPYALEGAVVPGRGIGSRLTVPTLNLAPAEKVLPATGVYITRTSAAGHGPGPLWPSVTNVGYRPSFSGDRLIVETHLLQKPGGAAPRGIRIEFLRRLREERKVPSAEELRSQILRDAARARRHFERLRRQGPGASVVLTTKESRGGSRVSN
jgi:riboflavin kinase/FMN adenylyltransferase